MNPADLLPVWVDSPEHEVSSYWMSGPSTPKKLKKPLFAKDRLLCSSIIAYVRSTLSGLFAWWMLTKSVLAQDLLVLCTFPQICVHTAFTWLSVSVSLARFSTCRAVACPGSLQMLHFILFWQSLARCFSSQHLKQIPLDLRNSLLSWTVFFWKARQEFSEWPVSCKGHSYVCSVLSMGLEAFVSVFLVATDEAPVGYIGFRRFPSWTTLAFSITLS